MPAARCRPVSFFCSTRTSLCQPTLVAMALRNLTALVTGSTSGIGAAIATTLGRAGANLVVHGLVSSPAAAVDIRKQFEADTGSKVRLRSTASLRIIAYMGLCTRVGEVVRGASASVLQCCPLARAARTRCPHPTRALLMQVMVATHNVASATEIEKLVAEAKAEFGRIDILVRA